MNYEWNEQDLTTRVTIDGRTMTLRLRGELAAAAIEPLRWRLAILLDEHAPDVVVDLEELSFASINGLGLLVWLVATVRQRGRSITILRPSARLMELLTLARLERVLPIRQDPSRLSTAGRTLSP